MCISFEHLKGLGREYGGMHADAWDREIDRAQPGRPDDPDLYVGHHGASQGRDDHPGERDVHDGHDDGQLHRPFDTDEQLGFLPLAHVAGRIFYTFLGITAASVVNLVRKPGNHGPGPAGGVADRSLRGAEGVGETVLRGGGSC